MSPRKLALLLLLSEDGTFDLNGEPVWFQEGYQVGGFAPTLVNPAPDELEQWIRKHKRRGGPFYLGSWTDPETGDRHIDLTLRMVHPADAMSVARAHGEKAIWSWTTDRVMSV